MDDYPMEGDRPVGDGGGVTVYERPDGSRYALDPNGRGHEVPWGVTLLGPPRFDARALADGRWPGSRSRTRFLVRTRLVADRPRVAAGQPPRMRAVART